MAAGAAGAASACAAPAELNGAAAIVQAISPLFIQQQKLLTVDGAKSDHLGQAVALSGDTLAVGALGRDIGATPSQGSVYIFTRSTAGWVQQQRVTANDGTSGNRFGSAVALSSDTLAVGAPRDDVNTNVDQGSAYVFGHPPCPDIVLAPAGLPDGTSGTPYQQHITVSGGVGPHLFELANGTLPPGFSLTGLGILSGKPTTPGTYQFTISTTDLNSFCSASRTYTLTITEPKLCPTITIDPPTLPNGIRGKAYSQTLAAVGGAGPYKFVPKTPLPPGLSLNVNGVLSGTPTQAGQFTFAAQVTDANGCIGSRVYSIRIIQA